MSTPIPKSDYLLLFRGTQWEKGLSPKEIQQVMAQIMAWITGLQKQGTLKAGRPLGDEARTVSGRQVRTVADGPFAESKEAIGGYLIVQVAGMEEAVALAKQYPCLNYGASVEVRPVAEECPTFKRAQEQLAEAAV